MGSGGGKRGALIMAGSSERGEPGASRAYAAQHCADPAHAFQVCRLALSLFDQLGVRLAFPARERVLLEAAALLHDIGYAHGAPAHHKRSRDMILTLDLPGLSIRERMAVACIARYHRKAFPRPVHAVYCDLRPDEQEMVRRLSAIVRLADGLDRCHAGSVERVAAIPEVNTLRLAVYQRRRNDIDLSTAAAKADLFTEVFALRVEIGAVDGDDGGGHFAVAGSK